MREGEERPAQKVTRDRSAL